MQNITPPPLLGLVKNHLKYTYIDRVYLMGANI